MFSFRFITFLTLLSLAFMLVFGVMGMRSDNIGQMSDCPFVDGGALCQMNVFEHLGAFRDMFVGIPSKSIAFFVALLILIVSSQKIPEINAPPNHQVFFVKTRLRLPNFNKTLAALSDGRMQPKLYA